VSLLLGRRFLFDRPDQKRRRPEKKERERHLTDRGIELEEEEKRHGKRFWRTRGRVNLATAGRP